jgi:GT2 family glycosyltransferase
LERTLQAIVEMCPMPYEIKILSQGPASARLENYTAKLRDTSLISLERNVGCGPGRQIVTEDLGTTFAMTLDDDMLITREAISTALSVLDDYEDIGAIGIPQYGIDGRMLATGGARLVIRDNVIHPRPPVIEANKIYSEVQDLDGGAMIFKSKARKDFGWDPRIRAGFDDMDKSLQIWTSGKWKQAIIPHAKLVHDFSKTYDSDSYSKVRFDWIAIRDSYRFFCKKWRMRLELKSHLLYDRVYPALLSLPTKEPLKVLSRFVLQRSLKTMQTFARNY